MVYLYIASMKGYSGKSLITLGLGLLLKDEGFRLGYVKPFGTTPLKEGERILDADADFMRTSLGVDDPPEIVSPFVATFETQAKLLKGKNTGRLEAVMKAVQSIQGRDAVLLGGGADLFEGAAYGVNALKIIERLAAQTIVVEPWNGDSSIDTLIGARELLGTHFCGAVLNKLPDAAHDYVTKTVVPYLEKQGIPVFAALHRDILLDSITVRSLNDILGGKVLCGEQGLDEFIESFSIGAMDVDSALRYFRRTPNKAVITGAHRSDIQLAALETSTRCIILTGGLYTNDVIIGKAKAAGVPVLSVHDDTFTTVGKIEAVLGKIRIREQKKVVKTREIIAREFNLDRLLQAVGLRPGMRRR